jgi:hypothetical protein
MKLQKPLAEVLTYDGSPSETLHLAPPSIKVLARLMTNRIQLDLHLPYLLDAIKQGRSWSELHASGFAPLRIASVAIRCGLGMVLTRSPRGSVVWVQEIRCHPWCSILGGECQAYNLASEWIEKLHRKHEHMLDCLPSA